MDWTSLLAGSTAAQQLAQYPDAKLYNAAAKLKPEERPKVPVRTVNNDWKRSRPAIMWFDSARPDHISMSTSSPQYRKGDIQSLAAALAHEAIHAGGEMGELPAYAKETEVLQRLGLGSSQRAKNIEQIRKQFAK